MSTVVRIPFRGGEVLAVDVDGKPQVFLRPVIEALGLDYSAQYRKLQRRSWACVGFETTQLPGDAQSREFLTVDVRTLTMLLATVDENRVAEAARPALIAYQSEVADAIEAYWTKGGAINPRATTDQLDSFKGQMEVLRLGDGFIDPAWLEAKMRHIAARALGEEPEVDPTTRPLTVGEFLEGHGVTGSALRSTSSMFGKRVKAEYRKVYGGDPLPVERWIDGALRPVAGYTETHRHLFKHVWAEYFADRNQASS